MSTSRANPISIKGLWENSWVFALYGLCLGLVIGSMETLKLDLSKVEQLMMEPLSFYAFSLLSLAGLVGLGVINVTTSKTAEAMHSSAWVKNFWVPVSNAGLSTGAIVMGMMFGLAMGLSPWLGTSGEVKVLVKLLFAMSAFILALLYPLTLMKRSMFDLTKEEERASVIAGLVYCIALALAFWFIDQQVFWRFLGTISGASIFVGFIIMRLTKKRS